MRNFTKLLLITTICSLFLIHNKICAVARVSVGSGNFMTAGTWSPAGVPASGDDITVSAGHIVTISGSHVTINNLTINGIVRFGDMASSRTLNVFGNCTISATGTLDIDPASNFTNVIKFFGDVSNDGTYNVNPDANSLGVTYMLRAGSQTFSGTGTNNFYRIDVRNGNTSRTTEFTCTNFVAPANFLILNSGVAKFSIAQSGTLTPFNTNATVGSTAGLWINSSNANFTVTGSLYINGILTVETGTLTTTGSMAVGNNISSISGTYNHIGGLASIGVNLDFSKGTTSLSNGTITVANNVIIGATFNVSGGILNAGSVANRGILFNGGTATISGGTVNVSGYIGRYTTSAVTNLNISGGTTTINTTGMTTAGTPPFNILTAGSVFNMINGSVIIQRSGASNSGIQFTGLAANGITGGSITLGNGSTPASTTMLINTPVQLYNVIVNSSNVTASLNTNALTIANDLTINSGNLNSNALNISILGDWTNSGGTFNGGTATVTFNGSGAQSLGKSSGTETFNNLTISSTSSSSLTSAISGRNLTIDAGGSLDVSASSYSVSLIGNFNNNGTFTSQSGNINFNGSSAQTISSSTATTFYDLTGNNTSGGVSFTSGTFSINNSMTLSNGSLSKTARIGVSNSSGSFSGNFIIQKHISARVAGWHEFASPVTSTTLYDWDDEMYMSGVSASDNPVGIAGDDGSASGFQSVYTYDESGSAYDYPVTNTFNLTVGGGYGIWLADDVTNWNAKTIDSRGTPNKGTISIPVQNTGDGNNLVGNPFASYVLWGSCTRSNIDANFYMLDNSGNFNTYGLADEIPPHQGFWVYSSSGSPSLSISENAKTTTTSTQHYRRADKDFTLTLASGLTPYYQTIRLNKNDAASLAYDSDFDGIYIKSPFENAPSLTMAIDGQRELITNFVPTNENEIAIPLRVKSKISGEYSIKASNINLFSEYECIYLEDTKEGVIIDLLKNQEYKFYHEAESNPNRFVLHFNKEHKICNARTQAFSYSRTDEVKFISLNNGIKMEFDLDEVANSRIYIIDMTGNFVKNETNFSAHRNTYQLLCDDLASGVYQVVVEYNGKRISKKFVVIK